ncbi:MAG: 50S ribosomal protein L23 [Candidatus Moraniibacteriota bacterium]|nr:MAG: 50S ribosomal protein L23 [Candidatus Moranbacteria bacterium]
MALLTKRKKEIVKEDISSLKSSKTKSSKKNSDKEKKKDVAIKGQTGRVLSSIVLRKPYVTEKSHELAQKGTYVFEVKIDADKEMIRRAVEELYSVKVVAVRTIRQKGIERKFGRSLGKTRNFKKAMVTLRKGQTIEVFQGA